MIQRHFFGKIHKVTAGTSPRADGLAFTVGSQIPKEKPKYEITEIVIDEFMYEKYGKISIMVFAKKISEQESFPFYQFIDVPVTLVSDNDQY